MQAIDVLNRWGEAATKLAGAALWQSLVVAAAVALVAVALRRSSPAARYWLWQIVALKLLLVPVWSWSLPLAWLPAEQNIAAQRAERDHATAPMADIEPPATVAPPPLTIQPVSSQARPVAHTFWQLSAITWQGWVLLAWAAVVAVQVVRLIVLRQKLMTLLHDAAPGGDELTAAVARVGRSLHLVRLPAVLVVEVDCSPFVCGVVRPAIVLPHGLADELTGDELNQVLAHELAHLKRRDLVWGWTVEIARLVYFFNPVAHYVAYRVRLERELACDQVAMHHSGRSPAEYAQTLVRVLSAASSPSVFRTSAAASLDGGDVSLGKGEAGR